mmetsp:Transcript_14185/g.20960  ORF Transcript_14185/g.20960 Transcript_14185/m.20960 type:complete len:406 (-) Transcript_14185:223-1440(-)
MNGRLSWYLINYPFLFGLIIRFLVAWALPLLLDNGVMISGVAYTDIDYHVFSDAANYIQLGQSPYLRHTYRYTPFLAWILSKVNGRYLFCFADTVCGKLILQLRKRHKDNQRSKLLGCCLWMYNPIAINICTRGSAESFVVLLPVLLTVTVSTCKIFSQMTKAFIAGICHGIAVHAKVYPIIYTLSFMANFGRFDPQPIDSPKKFILVWIHRLTRLPPLVFATSFALTFAGLTYLAVIQYGRVALDEGLLYHLSRVDHRHNYSPWWYPIYLANRQAPGALLLIPQTILLFVTSLSFESDLGFTLLLQTYIFVTFNKVITAQYFTWYLCLLPICRQLHWSLSASVGVGLSIIAWLTSAYTLELLGWPTHRLVWTFSILHFLANVNMLRKLIHSYKPRLNDRSEKLL